MTAAGMSVPTVDRQQLGAAAEDAALALLIEQGCSLLARNVRYKFGELDLVMRDAVTLAFVEVRFRRNSRFGGAAMSVDVAKRRKVARAAQAWLGSHRQYAYAACRFDVVAVTPGRFNVLAVTPGRGETAAAGPNLEAMECEWIRAAFTLDDLY